MGRAESRAREPSDEALALRVQKGDREAFEQLVRRYLRMLHGVVASILDEEADVADAVQDAFLRALDRIDTYDPMRPFAPWIYQIARNVARNERTRAGRRRSEALADRLVSRDPGPEIVLERAEVRRRVEEELGRLPTQQRVAFRLVDVEGHRIADVARLMDLSEGTVRSHLHHARRALREAVHQLDPRGSD